jgi:hypothetical protein
MTEELKKYLDSTKEDRKKLAKIAENVKSSQIAVMRNVEDLSNDFPSLNPKRFKNYEEVIHQELQSFFGEDHKTPQRPRKGRSLAGNEKKIASVYQFLNVRAKKMTFLPPIVRDKEKSVPERLLGGKYLTRAMESAPSVESFEKSVKRDRLNRFQVKQLLLEPVLKQKYLEESEKGRSRGFL